MKLHRTFLQLILIGVSLYALHLYKTVSILREECPASSFTKIIQDDRVICVIRQPAFGEPTVRIAAGEIAPYYRPKKKVLTGRR